MKGSLILVVNLASEKVPAPPSPNWTLLLTSSSPVLKKCSTSLALSLILLPFSMTIGFNPASTKRYVAKIPLGPYPTTIGLISLSIMVALVSIGLYKLTFLSFR